MKKQFRFLLIALLILSLSPIAQAQDAFENDLFITKVNVENYVVLGKQVRFYVEVGSSSVNDLRGVVKVYDEKLGRFVGVEQAVSVLAGKTDAVFFDYLMDEKSGTRDFNIRVIADNPTGDNPGNNTQKTQVYVDVDSDKDGTPNKVDQDDDNDGAKDEEDAFPLNSKESLDTDGDGSGNNTDADDDNDGVSDAQDAFPLDANETKDGDGDGRGDNSDAFPTDPKENEDTDGDGLGNNADTNDNNKGPIVNFSTPENVVPSRSDIPFEAKSSDPDGKVVSYDWDFGDGLKGKGAVVEHEFKKSGDYQVTLKVTDDQGESRSKSIKITVVHKWQAYVLGAAAFLLFFLLLLYWLLSRKKEQGVKSADGLSEDLIELDLQANHLTKKPLSKVVSKKSSLQKGRTGPKKALPKKKK